MCTVLPYEHSSSHTCTSLTVNWEVTKRARRSETNESQRVRVSCSNWCWIARLNLVNIAPCSVLRLNRLVVFDNSQPVQDTSDCERALESGTKSWKRRVENAEREPLWR